MRAAAIADLSAFGVAASENSSSSRWAADPTRRRGSAGSFGKGKLGRSMQTIFDSKALPAAKRRQAWQDAICEIYLQVDCAAEQENDYEGFVRELRFGAMTLTDTRCLRPSRCCAEAGISRASRRIATSWGSRKAAA